MTRRSHRTQPSSSAGSADATGSTRFGDVRLDGAVVRFRDVGTGPCVVFVHGVWVGGSVWDEVVARLGGYRCVVATWPLGAHRDPAPHADLSARATAVRIPALLEALDLHDVTLVGNDTGGGLCLAALGTGHPGWARVGRLVLTDCDSYEHFPPKGFDRVVNLAQRSPRLGATLLRFFASRGGRRLFLRSVCTNPPTGARARSIFEAFATDAAARRDALRVTRSLEPSVTLDAVDALKAFPRPVLLAWGDQDRLFPIAHARRLLADFPDAALEIIKDSSTFVMVDRPDELAATITRFVTRTKGA